MATLVERRGGDGPAADGREEPRADSGPARSSRFTLFVDPTRAEQIIANLLTNAAKYTNKGGTNHRSRLPENREAVIQVIDTGIGLPPEMLHRVFDLFAQADRTLDRSEGGLGIGLTVARKLAEMHGGSISADSEGLGRGSTFTVRLPLADPVPGAGEPTIRAVCVPTPRAPQDSDRRRQPRYGRLVCLAVSSVGGTRCKPLTTESRRWSWPARSGPRPSFLDIGLPGMNGFEVVKTLRDEGFTDEVIVAVSGYGQPEDRQRSRDAGFDEHLVKPVHQDALLSALRADR